MSSLEELLEKEIALLAQQLRMKKASLASMRQANALVKRADLPYIGMRASTACARILAESGIPMTMQALIKRAAELGATYGKKRGEHNVRIGIEAMLAGGKFKQVGDLIGLSTWSTDLFLKN